MPGSAPLVRRRAALSTLAIATTGLIIGAQIAFAGSAGAAPHIQPAGTPNPIDPKLPPLSSIPGLSNLPNITGIPGLPGIQGITNTVGDDVTNPAVGGSFTQPFAEPGVNCPNEAEGSPVNTPTGQDITCKPAAVSVAVLPNGKILYWDGLEAEENNNISVVTEFGDKAANDQSRLLDLYGASGPTWSNPSPVDGGADDTPYRQYLVPNAPGPLKAILNDPGSASGALFCSDQVLLANGDLLVPGGTDYYLEPRIPNTPFGISELEGIPNTRLYNPATNTWTQTDPMHYGRWYPSLVTLGNGNVFVASGVTKLLKPIYTENPLLSGTNVEQTETFDPATGKWTYNGSSADHSLPLFPRLHLLPDGHIYYDAGGQVFNPFGQSYDEAIWNAASVYNPQTAKWRNVGVPFGISLDSSDLTRTSLTAGFRGSSFSVELPLAAPYTKAQFLSAGGVLGTSPGTYLANDASVIDTVDTAKNDKFTSTATGPLNNARWFSTAVVLPTGNVLAFNGANRDDVLLPGTTFPVHQTEEFDPATNTWTKLASSIDPRTYHNTAVLLPTGQVLVGGNSPISTLYAYNQTLPGGFSNDFRDPSFEIYNPPYLNWGIAQPAITSAPQQVDYGKTMTVTTDQAASKIAKVVLVRNTALTHLIDGDQKTIDLPIVSRAGKTLTVDTPPSGDVAPPGSYMLFADETTPKGLIPSVAQQVAVGVPMPSYVNGSDQVPTAQTLTSRIDALTASYGSASTAPSSLVPQGEGANRGSQFAKGLSAGITENSHVRLYLPHAVSPHATTPADRQLATRLGRGAVAARPPAGPALAARPATPSRLTADSGPASGRSNHTAAALDAVGLLAVLAGAAAHLRRRRRIRA